MSDHKTIWKHVRNFWPLDRSLLIDEKLFISLVMEGRELALEIDKGKPLLPNNLRLIGCILLQRFSGEN